MSAPNFTKLFEFCSLIGQLKRVKRTGWVLHKVSDPESVADHMYRMSIMSFLADASSGINKEKCIKLSLVHDMAESIVGDIAPADCVDKDEKHKKEKTTVVDYFKSINWDRSEILPQTAMNHITGLVSDEIGTELMNLWLEYEEQKSADALFVKDLDRFDMIFQAYEYEQLESKPGSLQEFFDTTKGTFKTDTVQSWVTELEKIRNQSTTLSNYSSPHLKRAANQSTSHRESAKVKPFIHGE